MALRRILPHVLKSQKHLESLEQFTKLQRMIEELETLDLLPKRSHQYWFNGMDGALLALFKDQTSDMNPLETAKSTFKCIEKVLSFHKVCPNAWKEVFLFIARRWAAFAFSPHSNKNERTIAESKGFEALSFQLAVKLKDEELLFDGLTHNIIAQINAPERAAYKNKIVNYLKALHVLHSSEERQKIVEEIQKLSIEQQFGEVVIALIRYLDREAKREIYPILKLLSKQHLPSLYSSYINMLSEKLSQNREEAQKTWEAIVDQLDKYRAEATPDATELALLNQLIKLNLDQESSIKTQLFKSLQDLAAYVPDWKEFLNFTDEEIQKLLPLILIYMGGEDIERKLFGFEWLKSLLNKTDDLKIRSEIQVTLLNQVVKFCEIRSIPEKIFPLAEKEFIFVMNSRRETDLSPLIKEAALKLIYFSSQIKYKTDKHQSCLNEIVSSLERENLLKLSDEFTTSLLIILSKEGRFANLTMKFSRKDKPIEVEIFRNLLENLLKNQSGELFDLLTDQAANHDIISSMKEEERLNEYRRLYVTFQTFIHTVLSQDKPSKNQEYIPDTKLRAGLLIIVTEMMEQLTKKWKKAFEKSNKSENDFKLRGDILEATIYTYCKTALIVTDPQMMFEVYKIPGPQTEKAVSEKGCERAILDYLVKNFEMICKLEGASMEKCTKMVLQTIATVFETEGAVFEQFAFDNGDHFFDSFSKFMGKVVDKRLIRLQSPEAILFVRVIHAFYKFQDQRHIAGNQEYSQLDVIPYKHYKDVDSSFLVNPTDTWLNEVATLQIRQKLAVNDSRITYIFNSLIYRYLSIEIDLLLPQSKKSKGPSSTSRIAISEPLIMLLSEIFKFIVKRRPAPGFHLFEDCGLPKQTMFLPTIELAHHFVGQKQLNEINLLLLKTHGELVAKTTPFNEQHYTTLTTEVQDHLKIHTVLKQQGYKEQEPLIRSNIIRLVSIMTNGFTQCFLPAMQLLSEAQKIGVFPENGKDLLPDEVEKVKTMYLELLAHKTERMYADKTEYIFSYLKSLHYLTDRNDEAAVLILLKAHQRAFSHCFEQLIINGNVERFKLYNILARVLASTYTPLEGYKKESPAEGLVRVFLTKCTYFLEYTMLFLDAINMAADKAIKETDISKLKKITRYLDEEPKAVIDSIAEDIYVLVRRDLRKMLVEEALGMLKRFASDKELETALHNATTDWVVLALHDFIEKTVFADVIADKPRFA
jgi:hypothetical protein